MLLKKGLRKPYQAQQASSRCVAVALLQHFSGYHLCCSCALSLLLYVLGSVCIVLCHFCFVFCLCHCCAGLSSFALSMTCVGSQRQAAHMCEPSQTSHMLVLKAC
jgi:hypothetical protein